MAGSTIRVRGYRELMRAFNEAEKDTKKVVGEKLKEAGDIIREDAYRRFERYSVKSASGYRVRARVGGVFVEQSRRKVTGLRPDWGATQMRKALEPALDANSSEVERRLEKAVDEIADIVDRRVV